MYRVRFITMLAEADAGAFVALAASAVETAAVLGLPHHIR
jgi:hypothetical protein